MSRRIVLPLVALAALAIAGCGGDDPQAASSVQQPRGGGGPMAAFSDPEVAACLKKQGVEVPSGRGPRGGGTRTGTMPQGPPPEGAPQGGQPPQGAPQGGRPPQGQGQGDSAQFEKLRKALAKCGVDLPQPGQGGQGGGQAAPPTATQSS